MKLTDGEKLILLMLSDIHEKLDIESEIDPAFIRSAIYDDQLWGIPSKYGGIPFEDIKDPKIVTEVVKILDMWRFIEGCYQILSSEDKAKLEKEATPYGKNPKFPGFDGIYETKYMSVAMFLVNKLDLFGRFKGRAFNSHCRSIKLHRMRLEVFESLRSELDGHILVDDLIAILNANRQPPAIKNK